MEREHTKVERTGWILDKNADGSWTIKHSDGGSISAPAGADGARLCKLLQISNATITKGETNVVENQIE